MRITPGTATGSIGAVSLQDGVDSGIKATILDYANSNPIAVRLTDTGGDYVSAGAGTQYTEGDVDVSITGTALMWEDAADTLRAVSSSKPLPVDITDTSIAVTGTFWQATQPVSIAAAVAVTQSGTWDEVGINDSGNLISIDDGGGNISVDWAGTVPPIGAGVEATALRVTIATDSTGVVSVDDNGGALTVDGTVTANAGTGTFIVGDAGAIINLDASGDAQVDILSIAAGDNNIGNVDIVTMPNVTIGTMANLTESLVDDAAFTPATSRVLPIGAELDNTLPDSVDEGDIGALRMSANRNLFVTLRDAAGNERGLNVDASGNIGVTDASGSLTVDGTVTANAGTGTFIVGDAGAIINLDASGDVQVDVLTMPTTTVTATDLDIRDLTSVSDSVAAVQSGTWNIGTVATVSALGNSTTGPQKAEDVASADADVGIPSMAVRKATPANTSGTDGDYEFLQMSAGRLWTSSTIDAALPAGTNAIGKLVANSGVDIGDVDILSIAAGDNNIGNVDIASALPAGTNAIGKLAANSGVDIGDIDVTSIIPGTGATNLGKAEDAAHSSGDTGIMLLGIRDDDPVAAVSGTAGDYEPLHTDARGILWSRNVPDTTDLANLGGEHVKKYYTNAGAVTDGIIWSPAAGTRWYITDIFINVSAAATVTLEDDLAGGDSAIWKAELAANSGWSHSFKTPWFSGEDAADLIITTSAANVYCMVCGYEI